MIDPSKIHLLTLLLRDVSRSFYLTLRVLPFVIRPQISLAYLLARAADSIADTEILNSRDRLKYLIQFRDRLRDLNHPDQNSIESWVLSLPELMTTTSLATLSLKSERKLLIHLPLCFDLLKSFSEVDREQVIDVVCQLMRGMELDLKRFSDPHTLIALETFEELEEYTYHVAGCVGSFWTRMCMDHIPTFRSWDLDQMSSLGIRFGKALQWTNILRDLPRDLKNGRCYLPSKDLIEMGLTSVDLKNPSNYSKLAPLYHRYLDHALEHYRAACEYVLFIPKSSFRVRLACIWPIWIGLETLRLLRTSDNPLNPNPRIRISRKAVYEIMLKSMFWIFSNQHLQVYHETLLRKLQFPN